MSEEWQIPETIWCANINGAEMHFDEGSHKELVSWLNETSESITRGNDCARFERFYSETIYGEEITFCFADVGMTFISNAETRRKSRMWDKFRRQERIEQGFMEEE